MLLVHFLTGLRLPRGSSTLWSGYALAGLIMVALSAAQFIPMKEFIEHSYDRATGARWDYVTENSLHPRDLVTFLAPKFFCHPRQEGYYWGNLGYWEYCAYLGIAPLLLAALFPFLRRRARQNPAVPEDKHCRRKSLFFLGLLVLATVLAFGKYSPVFRLFYRIVPGINRFRVPSRAVLFYAVSMAWFAAAALDRLILLSKDQEPWKDVSRRKSILTLSVIIALFLAPALLFFWRPAFILEGLGLGRFWPIKLIFTKGEHSAAIYAIARQSVIVFLTFLVPSGILLFLMLTRIVRTHLAAFALCALCIADLLFFGIPMLETTPAKTFAEVHYTRTELTDLLSGAARARERFAWMDEVFFWQNDQNQMEVYPNRAMMHGLNDIRGYDPVYLAHYGKFFNAISRYGDDKSPGGFLKFEELYNPNILSALNVRYLLTYSRMNIPGWTLARSFHTGLQVYENPAPFGNAFLASSAPIPIEDETKVLRALANPDMPLRRMAITYDINPWQRSPEPGTLDDESVEILEWTPNRRVCKARVNGSDTLVLSEVWYPGWRVYVNGTKTTHHPVYHAFMGIFLPPGEHEIVCVFRPFSIMTGLCISFATLLALILIPLIAKARKHG